MIEEVILPKNRVAVLRPRFALASVLTCFFLSTLTMTSWSFDIPILRTLLPGFPGMIPTTALVLAVLGLTVLLALAPETPTSQTSAVPPSLSLGRWILVFGLSLVLMLLGLGTLAFHIFATDTAVNLNFIFSQVPHQSGILAGGNMSIQTAFTAVLLSATVSLHLILSRFEDRISEIAVRRFVFLIQLFPLMALGICLLATIGYLQDFGRLFGSTKYVGFSLPTLISYTLLSVSALQLRRNSGYVALLIGDGSAGLFLRRFVVFSIFGPLLITFFISWGESQALYPDTFSMGLFVIFTIGALTATSMLTAKAIQETEDQRVSYERQRGQVALQETEESLRETKDSLQFALDASGMGTWEMDLVGPPKLRWSATTERLFGLAPGTFQGHPEEVSALIHPDDIQTIELAQAAAIAEHRDLDIDFRCVKPDGLSRWLRSKGRATYDSRGTPLKFSGTVLDITREKFHQKTIEDALQAAESANDLKSNFLASMSHEIRTPLGAILGFTELLRDSNVTQAERDEYLKVIARNGETLSQLINDILDLSKVEAGHMNIENIRFSLKATVEEVTTLLRNKAEKKGLKISIHYGAGLPTSIVSDPVRLKQILFNLVGNAVKFTPEGEISIEVNAERNLIYFDVRDTGIGIKSDQRQHLFQPFIQADGSITRRFGGTGLGLSLSRNLANLLGGGVELRESEVGRGSVFRATIENRETTENKTGLPTTSANQADDAANSAADIEKNEHRNISLDGVEILVVDDSIDNQNLIEHILRKRGAKLFFADDGMQATRKAAEHSYDVILMDIQMPVLDGLAATQIVRQQGFKGPIIALTAHAMKDTHADCLRVGCTGFLSKPIDSRDLVKTIHRLLHP